jgi:hypothetical protein
MARLCMWRVIERIAEVFGLTLVRHLATAKQSTSVRVALN